MTLTALLLVLLAALCHAVWNVAAKSAGGDARFALLSALLVMVGCSAFAVHPLITIAACGVWLAPLHPDPNLLAITLLMGWGIGIPVNPLSGLHLVIQGRYGIDGYAFPRWNRVYTLKCLGAGIVLLYLYGALLGVSA